MKKTHSVCRSAFRSSFSELGHRWCLHSWSRLLYVNGCVLWSLKSQTTASLICKPQGTQMMYRDKPALQTIAHCFPGLMNVLSHACFQSKLKKGYSLLAVQQDIWPRASPARLKDDTLTVPSGSIYSFNSKLINNFNSLGINCIGERWQNTTTWINLLFKWGKMPCTLCTRVKEWRRKRSYSFTHTASSGNWLCSLLKWLCYASPPSSPTPTGL